MEDPIWSIVPLPNSVKDNKNNSLIKVFISLSLSLSYYIF